MRTVLLYSGLLVAGMAASQLIDLAAARPALTTITMICLAYIMVQVGLEFSIDKTRLGSYGIDYLVAATAAAFPWILCAAYLLAVLDVSWRDALLIGRFAAPTSAGVLFAMLAAAGLSTTWLYRKAQVLAIFDDLDTVLFMVPLQMLFTGMRAELALGVLVMVGLVVAAYVWLHTVPMPATAPWLLAYGAAIVAACELLEHGIDVHLEVLLPAFALGCMLRRPPHDEDGAAPAVLDLAVKAVFMLLVGCSLPRLTLGGISLGAAAAHVVALTVLSNVGKCFPTFCYAREATLRERVALSVAMFPRGEVGAGVLLIAIGYGLGGVAVGLGGASLALNLLLTGVFIAGVRWLIAPSDARREDPTTTRA